MLVEAAVSSTNTNRAGQTDPVPAPIAARQRIKTVLDARERGTEEKVKQAPLTLAKQQLAEQNRKIARLEEQLAAAQNDASLFDLRRDSADEHHLGAQGEDDRHRHPRRAQGALQAGGLTPPRPGGPTQRPGAKTAPRLLHWRPAGRKCPAVN